MVVNTLPSARELKASHGHFDVGAYRVAPDTWEGHQGLGGSWQVLSPPCLLDGVRMVLDCADTFREAVRRARELAQHRLTWRSCQPDGRVLYCELWPEDGPLDAHRVWWWRLRLPVDGGAAVAESMGRSPSHAFDMVCITASGFHGYNATRGPLHVVPLGDCTTASHSHVRNAG